MVFIGLLAEREGGEASKERGVVERGKEADRRNWKKG